MASMNLELILTPSSIIAQSAINNDISSDKFTAEAAGQSKSVAFCGVLTYFGFMGLGAFALFPAYFMLKALLIRYKCLRVVKEIIKIKSNPTNGTNIDTEVIEQPDESEASLYTPGKKERGGLSKLFYGTNAPLVDFNIFPRKRIPILRHDIALVFALVILANIAIYPYLDFDEPVASNNDYKTAEIYDSMRLQTLSLKASQLEEYNDSPVLCVIMEMGSDKGVATHVSFVDGAASIYLSDGGGTIGMSENSKIKNISLDIIKSAPEYLPYTQTTKDFPLPNKDYNRVYIITQDDVRTCEVSYEKLRNKSHELSPLFYKFIKILMIAREQAGIGSP